MDELNQIESHIERLVALVRCATLKRVLHKVDPEPALNFWRLIYGNLMDFSVIEWCKTFGADSEDGHWKNIVIEPDSFRSELLNHLKLDASQWDAYWREMKHYRDNFAAHAGRSKIGVSLDHFPCLDIALESTFFYFQYLIGRLRELGVERKPNDLRSYAIEFEGLANKAAQAAIKATNGIRETVY